MTYSTALTAAESLNFSFLPLRNNSAGHVSSVYGQIHTTAIVYQFFSSLSLSSHLSSCFVCVCVISHISLSYLKVCHEHIALNIRSHLRAIFWFVENVSTSLMKFVTKCLMNLSIIES